MSETFTKAERICSQILVDRLFGGGNASMAAYPLRAVYMLMPADADGVPTEEALQRVVPAQVPAQVLISVPKRRLHHAVDRNRMKRQIREAYRRNKSSLCAALVECNVHLALAFVCISDTPCATPDIQRAVGKVLRRIEEKVRASR